MRSSVISYCSSYFLLTLLLIHNSSMYVVVVVVHSSCLPHVTNHHVPLVSYDVPSMNAFIECAADGLSTCAFVESQVVS